MASINTHLNDTCEVNSYFCIRSHTHTHEGWHPNMLHVQAMSSTISGYFVYLLSQEGRVRSGCPLLTWALCDTLSRLSQRSDCFPALPSCLSSTKHCVWPDGQMEKLRGVCARVNSVMVWKTCSITPQWPFAFYFYLTLCFQGPPPFHFYSWII